MKKKFFLFAFVLAIIVLCFSPDLYLELSEENKNSLFQSIIAMYALFTGFVMFYIGIAASPEPSYNEDRKFKISYKDVVIKRLKFALFIFFLSIFNISFVILNYIFQNVVLFSILMASITASLVLYFYLPCSFVRIYMDILDSRVENS